MTSGVAVSVNRAERTRMTIATPPLGAGKYSVKWAVVTENDNAHTYGAINFAVSGSAPSSSGAATSSGSAGTNQSMPASGSGDGWVATATIAIAGLVVLLLSLWLLARRRADTRTS